MTERIILVYKSMYGSTSKHAAWISQALDARLAQSKDVTPGNHIHNRYHDGWKYPDRKVEVPHDSGRHP